MSRAFKVLQRAVATEADLERTMRVLQTAPAPGRASTEPSPLAAGGATAAGAPLPEDVRARMEHSLGADFSAVRVHVGEAAPAVGARAYAQGSDLHFAPGEYQPDTARGQELIGHELTHVVQQAEGRVPVTQQRKGQGMNDDSSLEREADERGARAARGEPAGGGEGARLPAAATSAAPLQRMKFLPNGESYNEDWDKETSEPKHDTAQIEEFATWLRQLEVPKLQMIYEALGKLSNPSRDEAIARSRAKLLIDGKGEKSGKDQAKNPLGELPKDQWWKLFIDKGAHKEDQSNEQNAMRFDGESSPGYYDAMMRAYEQVLVPTEKGKYDTMTPDDLIKIHETVTTGTLAKSEQRFLPMPHVKSGKGEQGTQFPMTKGDEDVPSIRAFEELAEEGVASLDERKHVKGELGVDDDPNKRFLKLATKVSSPDTMTQVLPFSTYLVHTDYEQSDVEDIMKHLLDRYYREIKETDSIREDDRPPAKVETIVRLIRGLHTAHLFTDANGRLNTMVLLNKLLIQEGLDPVIMDDTSVFGGAFNLEQLVGQVRRGMNHFSEAVGGKAQWGVVSRNHGWFSYEEDPEPGIDDLKLVHAISLDLKKVPEHHKAKVQLVMQRFDKRAVGRKSVGENKEQQIEALCFAKSMDALLLENELETFTRD